jgi:hypothetical protein
MNNGFADEKPSDTGAEADDDQSPAESPETHPVDASGVADMLEPATAGPSVLRITDMDKMKQQKPKTVKAPEQTETKKQRQNRKKAEAAKEAREEAEKERKVLQEKQRRTARIAEGRSAKDGSQFKPAANGTNSWAKGAPNGTNGGSVGRDGSILHQPLDTFDKPAAPAASVKGPAPAKTETSWTSSLPSEEEQLEMLKDEADEWNTVPAKSSRKGKKSVESGDETPKQPAVQVKQAAPALKTAPKTGSSQSFGAFSALTDDAAEEVEEEWDV